MGKLKKLIEDFIADPTKVEMLPDLLAEADSLEKSELEAYSLVEKTQASNRSLLQRVTAQPDKDPEKEVLTQKDITSSIVEEMNGGKQ